ncbi:hypothetical protein GWK48_10555 [Metallosphaera tengchongensis]|uniref:CRISPR type III-associated protein domain-containing protein n=1 Tax=Metallosphaera tengchongensis TaxID=1532350 RepID=A0A6N0P0G8_9CREN|nr:RAMP superfamily CRISPR-associated protein [Metallosphaera tengchongensis]QKR00770.1 hypothetical protein GWK48_10555 [Metallosphaera tengchongensis]
MIKVEVIFKSLSALTIAGGSKVGAVDVPFNELGIPPSSVKGALRTAVSRYTPSNFTACSEVNPDMMRSKHASGPCDVCKLFGYPGSGESCFYVEVEGVQLEKYLLTRVAIEDKTQKAKEGSLFTQEVLRPGFQFKATLNYTCEDPRLFKLLLYSLLSLRLWRFGRNGMVDLKVTNPEQICKSTSCDNELKTVLSSLSNFLWGD